MTYRCLTKVCIYKPQYSSLPYDLPTLKPTIIKNTNTKQNPDASRNLLTLHISGYLSE